MSDVPSLMSDVRCPESDFRCKKSDVWCQISDVRCQISDVWFLVSDFRCPKSDVRCLILISDVWCQISNVRRLMFCCQTSNVRCQSSDVWCPVSDVWFLMFDVGCLMSGIRCRMFDVRCQTSDVLCLMSASSDFSCPMSDARCPVSDPWCMMSVVWFPTSDQSDVWCLMLERVLVIGSRLHMGPAIIWLSFEPAIIWNRRSFGTGDHNVWSSGIAKVEQKFLLAAIRYRDNLSHRLRVVQFQQSPRWLFWILIPFTFHLPWWSCKNTKIRLRLLGNAQEDMFEWTCQLRLFEKQIFTKKTKVTFFLTTKRTLEWCSTLTHLQFRHHLHTCYRPCLNVLRNGLKL